MKLHVSVHCCFCLNKSVRTGSCYGRGRLVEALTCLRCCHVCTPCGNAHQKSLNEGFSTVFKTKGHIQPHITTHGSRGFNEDKLLKLCENVTKFSQSRVRFCHCFCFGELSSGLIFSFIRFLWILLRVHQEDMGLV